MYYLLNEDHSVTKIDDVLEWGKTFSKNRRVAKDEFNGHMVSTVFLGLDHSFGYGQPLLFESMVFKDGSWNDLDSRRYATWDEAIAGHGELVEQWKQKTASI